MRTPYATQNHCAETTTRGYWTISPELAVPRNGPQELLHGPRTTKGCRTDGPAGRIGPQERCYKDQSKLSLPPGNLFSFSINFCYVPRNERTPHERLAQRKWGERRFGNLLAPIDARHLRPHPHILRRRYRRAWYAPFKVHEARSAEKECPQQIWKRSPRTSCAWRKQAFGPYWRVPWAKHTT